MPVPCWNVLPSSGVTNINVLSTTREVVTIRLVFGQNSVSASASRQEVVRPEEKRHAAHAVLVLWTVPAGPCDDLLVARGPVGPTASQTLCSARLPGDAGWQGRHQRRTLGGRLA